MNGQKKRILIAPLDWGLGHATRCIPIIYELTLLNFDVIIAANGKIKDLLQNDFPKHTFISLKGYNIRYSRHKYWLPLKIFTQLPKLAYSIYYEHRWLRKVVKQYNIDAVISDNRLGLFHYFIPCIYITHQLKIKTGNFFSEWLAQKIHYYFINKYTTCWVPDDESASDCLAGKLSHPKQLPKTTVKYIGPLSRFEKFAVEKKYDILLLISGPEPQRSIFEKLMLQQLKDFIGSLAVVRGLPTSVPTNEFIVAADNKTITANHLTSSALNKIILQSDVVICRSGYTTIMDVAKLGQKAIVVATPGQTEQVYLAKYLMDKKMLLSIAQDDFSLQDALKKSNHFSYMPIAINQNQYKKIISEFAEQLLKN